MFVVANVDDVTNLVPPLLAVHGDPAIVVDYTLRFKGERKFQGIVLRRKLIPFVKRRRSARNGMVIVVVVLIKPGRFRRLLFVVK